MSFGDTFIQEDGFGYAPKLRDAPYWKPYEIIKRYHKIFFNHQEIRVSVSLIIDYFISLRPLFRQELNILRNNDETFLLYLN